MSRPRTKGHQFGHIRLRAHYRALASDRSAPPQEEAVNRLQRQPPAFVPSCVQISLASKGHFDSCLKGDRAVSTDLTHALLNINPHFVKHIEHFVKHISGS